MLSAAAETAWRQPGRRQASDDARGNEQQAKRTEGADHEPPCEPL
jgi:hypothetical protein